MRPAKPIWSRRASSSFCSGPSSRSSSRCTSAFWRRCGSSDCGHAAHHPAVLAGRHRGQLRRGLVRNSRQHLRQLAHRIRRSARQTVSHLRYSAEGRHEHRHVADLGRAAHHALHPSLRPARLRRPMLHRLRHRRIAWAPRPCASPAASSPRSPTSAPTS